MWEPSSSRAEMRPSRLNSKQPKARSTAQETTGETTDGGAPPPSFRSKTKLDSTQRHHPPASSSRRAKEVDYEPITEAEKPLVRQNPRRSRSKSWSRIQTLNLRVQVAEKERATDGSLFQPRWEIPLARKGDRKSIETVLGFYEERVFASQRLFYGINYVVKNISQNDFQFWFEFFFFWIFGLLITRCFLRSARNKMIRLVFFISCDFIRLWYN